MLGGAQSGDGVLPEVRAMLDTVWAGLCTPEVTARGQAGASAGASGDPAAVERSVVAGDQEGRATGRVGPVFCGGSAPARAKRSC